MLSGYGGFGKIHRQITRDGIEINVELESFWDGPVNDAASTRKILVKTCHHSYYDDQSPLTFESTVPIA